MAAYRSSGCPAADARSRSFASTSVEIGTCNVMPVHSSPILPRGATDCADRPAGPTRPCLAPFQWTPWNNAPAGGYLTFLAEVDKLAVEIRAPQHDQRTCSKS